MLSFGTCAAIYNLVTHYRNHFFNLGVDEYGVSGDEGGRGGMVGGSGVGWVMGEPGLAGPWAMDMDLDHELGPWA